jgi:hypothetical protein
LQLDSKDYYDATKPPWHRSRKQTSHNADEAMNARSAQTIDAPIAKVLGVVLFAGWSGTGGSHSLCVANEARRGWVTGVARLRLRARGKQQLLCKPSEMPLQKGQKQ